MSETATQPVQAKKPDLTTVKGFEQVFNNYEKTIFQLLQNKHGITPQEFMVTAVNAIRKNPELLKCNPKSLFGAILLSAECGLKFNTPSQHAYIIPYKGEAQFQIGYQGLIEIMYRNPRVKRIDGHAVFEKDMFDYGYGLQPFLNHKPFRGVDKGKLVCVYAVCKLEGADPIFTVVEKNELDEIKKLSPASSSKFSPYNNGTDVHNWMEVKASIKKISKLIPKTSEIANVVDIDSKISSRHSVEADIITNPNEVAGYKIKEESAFGGAFDKYEEMETEKIEVEAIAPASAPVSSPTPPTTQQTEIPKPVTPTPEPIRATEPTVEKSTIEPKVVQETVIEKVVEKVATQPEAKVEPQKESVDKVSISRPINNTVEPTNEKPESALNPNNSLF